MTDDKGQTGTARKVCLTCKPRAVYPYYIKWGLIIDGPRMKQFKLTDGRVCRPQWYVSRVEKDGPAEREGIAPGDCILELYGKNVEGASLEYVKRCVPKWSMGILNMVVISDSHYQPSQHQQLYNAAGDGDLEAANNALEGGADINVHVGLDEWTPLHFASWNGYLEVVTKLINAGADLHSRDKAEWTPLHFASRNGYLEVVTKLINAGADLHSRDEFGDTPINFADRFGHDEVVKELLEAGAAPRDPRVLLSFSSLEAVFGDSSSDTDDPVVKDAQVPIEILTRGPEALRAYRKALQDGETHDRRVPVMIVGQERSGKTSLKKSLKGERFNPDEDSTVGIEVDPVLCHITTEVWRPEESEEFAGVKTASENKFERSTARLMKDMLLKIPREKEVKDTGQDSVYKRGSTTSSNTKQIVSVADKRTDASADRVPQKSRPEKAPVSKSRPEGVSNVPEDILELLRKDEITETDDSEGVSIVPEDILELLRKDEITETDDDVELVLWDFAGQSVFYTTHVLFLSRIAIYILTYDLSKELDAKAVPLVKHDMYERLLTDDKCETTNMDYIHYWLSSIHAFSSHSRTPSNESEHLPPKSPPVFLVGTHADKCSRPRKVAMEIMSDLKGKSYEEHVVGKVFTVNNTRSGSQEGEDEGIKKLRPEVLETARELPHMKELFPVRWLRLEKSLKSLKADGTSFTTLDIVRKKAQAVFEVEEENDFRTVINFLNDRHAVLHFSKPPELDRLVVLDHQWLIDVFKKVITVQPLECQERAFKKYWEELENEGVLRLELAKHVWKDLVPSKETVTSLLLMLEKFSLTCRWVQPDGSEVYLVPSMLMSEADSKILDLISSAEVPALIVRFANQYLPVGLFPRLVTRCVNWCSEEWSVRKQPKLCKNYARFFLGTDGAYQVILARGLNVISVSVIRGEKIVETSDADRLAHERSLATFCQAVLAFVKPALEEMQEEHLWMKLMSYTLCFKCPVCSRGGVRSGVCDLHRAARCTRDQCLHYVTEDELVHGPKTLVCCASEDATDATISRKKFTPWFAELDGKIGEEVEQERLDVRLSPQSAAANDVPGLVELNRLSREITGCWEFLGRQLGVEEGTLQNIMINNVQWPSPRQKAFEVLRAWRDMGSTSTYSQLARALEDEDLGRLAEQYCGQQLPSCEHSSSPKVVSSSVKHNL